MTVRFVNIDEPSDFFEVPSFGYGVDNQDKGPGKAMSYAVKYALLKALGLETGDDPEYDSIDHNRNDPAALGAAVAAAASAPSLDALASVWTSNKQFQTEPAFEQAKDRRKNELQPKDQAA